jgi:hypothetical protein
MIAIFRGKFTQIAYAFHFHLPFVFTMFGRKSILAKFLSKLINLGWNISIPDIFHNFLSPFGALLDAEDFSWFSRFRARLYALRSPDWEQTRFFHCPS